MGDRIPEEAVELFATWHYNWTHDIGEKHGTPWVKLSEEERDKSRKKARYRLGRLLAAIHRDLRGRLLGDEAAEAGAAKVRWAVRSQHRAEEQAHLVIEAALNAVLPEETDRG